MASLADDRYRFSGYDLTRITLDETGPNYVVVNQDQFTVRRSFETWNDEAVSVCGVQSSGAPPNLLEGNPPP